jgi:hypothetical protein
VGPLAALGLEELATCEVDDAGGIAFGAAADVDADDPAIDAVGAGVIAEAVGAGFPGHDGRLSEAAQMERALHTI